MRAGEVAYNIAAIRELLLAAFTAEELRRFCLVRPDFQPIVNRFSQGHSLDQMVDEVIDYCRTQLLFDELLSAVKETRYTRPEPTARLTARAAPARSRKTTSVPAGSIRRYP